MQKDDDTSSTKSGSSNNGIKKSTPPPIPIPVLALNPLHTLAEAAKVLNPVQFELPKDLACTTPLPGELASLPITQIHATFFVQNMYYAWVIKEYKCQFPITVKCQHL